MKADAASSSEQDERPAGFGVAQDQDERLRLGRISDRWELGPTSDCPLATSQPGNAAIQLTSLTCPAGSFPFRQQRAAFSTRMTHKIGKRRQVIARTIDFGKISIKLKCRFVNCLQLARITSNLTCNDDLIVKVFVDCQVSFL